MFYINLSFKLININLMIISLFYLILFLILTQILFKFIYF